MIFILCTIMISKIIWGYHRKFTVLVECKTSDGHDTQAWAAHFYLHSHLTLREVVSNVKRTWICISPLAHVLCSLMVRWCWQINCEESLEHEASIHSHSWITSFLHSPDHVQLTCMDTRANISRISPKHTCLMCQLQHGEWSHYDKFNVSENDPSWMHLTHWQI